MDVTLDGSFGSGLSKYTAPVARRGRGSLSGAVAAKRPRSRRFWPMGSHQRLRIRLHSFFETIGSRGWPSSSGRRLSGTYPEPRPSGAATPAATDLAPIIAEAGGMPRLRACCAKPAGCSWPKAQSNPLSSWLLRVAQFGRYIFTPPACRGGNGRGRPSFLRHPGLAQAGEIGGFEQGAYLRHPPISGPTDRSGGLEAGDARITAVRSQPSGFGELGRGAFTFALERIGGGDLAAAQRASWHSAARLFEPDDRLVNA